MSIQHEPYLEDMESYLTKNLGRLWVANTEIQDDFTCYNSYLLTLCTLHSQWNKPISP